MMKLRVKLKMMIKKSFQIMNSILMKKMKQTIPNLRLHHLIEALLEEEEEVEEAEEEEVIGEVVVEVVDVIQEGNEMVVRTDKSQHVGSI